MAALHLNPDHAFDLDYLVDNGRLRGWPTDYERGVYLVRWSDGDYSIVDQAGKPLGWGETEEEAISNAQYILTNRRRDRDGVVPAKVC